MNITYIYKKNIINISINLYFIQYKLFLYFYIKFYFHKYLNLQNKLSLHYRESIKSINRLKQVLKIMIIK